MTASDHDVLSAEELKRIERAEADAYEALFAVAGPRLGTGSQRLGDALVIWHPSEDEAGYNCVINFHLSQNLDVTYDEASRLVRESGARVFGVPIDERVASWATAEQIANRELTYQSDEVIWARRIDTNDSIAHPLTPDGISVAPSDLEPVELQRIVNIAWGLDDDDPRGVLYSFSPDVPGWKTYLARSGNEIAGFSVFCSYRQVGLLMLAVVMPIFRGRGLQSFFIQERLAEAADRGCNVAMSETNDKNASPRNLERAGFHTCITRQVFSQPIIAR